MVQLSPSTPRLREAVEVPHVVEVAEAEVVSSPKTLKVTNMHKMMAKAMLEGVEAAEAAEVATLLKIPTTLSRALRILIHAAEGALEAQMAALNNKNAQTQISLKKGNMSVICMQAVSLRGKQPWISKITSLGKKARRCGARSRGKTRAGK